MVKTNVAGTNLETSYTTTGITNVETTTCVKMVEHLLVEQLLFERMPWRHLNEGTTK
jgi:hypothetical protein